jgi:hypothetical protein
MIALNNPAVCGAVSWRLAEYLNQGLFVLSFPFKIELPTDFVTGLLSNSITAKAVQRCDIDYLCENPDSRNHCCKGKSYFDAYCTPIAQYKLYY